MIHPTLKCSPKLVYLCQVLAFGLIQYRAQRRKWNLSYRRILCNRIEAAIISLIRKTHKGANRRHYSKGQTIAQCLLIVCGVHGSLFGPCRSLPIYLCGPFNINPVFQSQLFWIKRAYINFWNLTRDHILKILRNLRWTIR